MSIPINIKTIRLSATTQEISESLNYGDQVIWQGMAEVVSIQGKSNQDGTQNVQYLAKPLVADVKKSDTKVSIVSDRKIKDKSRSQALREKCFRIAQELGESSDGLYNLAMDEANRFIENYEANELGKGME